MLLQQLEKLEAEFLDLQAKMSDPEIISNQSEYIRISRRYKSLQSAADLTKEYREAVNGKSEAEEILAQESDAEMKDLAKDQLKECTDALVELDEKAKIELIPKDPNDDKDCIIEIRAGAGGDEAGIFAGELARMYMRYGENNGLKVELMNKNESSPGVVKEIVFALRGEQAFGKMKFESGVHRVQRVPVTESQGRVHTSTASVAVLPEAEEVDVELNEADVKVDVFRSSGPGGQSVNTTDSAVRLTHVPTGIVISCQDEKSQLKNKAKAFKILRTKLYDMELERIAKERGEARAGQIGTGDRSEKIRTYNFPQDRVTDHRIKVNWSNLPGVLGGAIEDIVENLQLADQENKLKGIAE